MANEICNFPYLFLFLHVSVYFILAISLDLCHDLWPCTFCHGNHIIPVPPPLPHPLLSPSSPSSFVFRLTRLNKSSHDARCHHLHCFVGFDLSHQCSFRWNSHLRSGLLFQFSFRSVLFVVVFHQILPVVSLLFLYAIFLCFR